MRVNKKYMVFASIIAVVFGLSNSGLHPVVSGSGFTGAPTDSACSQCHTGTNSNLDGTVTIDGLPSTIDAGATYTLTVTVTNPNGNAVKGGFQMLVLNGTNGNAGTFGSAPANTTILTGSSSRKYFGHSPAQNFPASNELSFTIDWTAPTTVGSNPVIKFYASAVIANGANGNQNDRVVLTNQIIPIQTTAQPLEVLLSNLVDPLCYNDQNGTATATGMGGVSPYTYTWSNGATGSVNNTLQGGAFTVTVTDNVGTTATANDILTDPAELLISTSGSEICDGNTNGTVSVLASGGTGGITYLWTNGATSSTVSNLPLGLYSVTVTDGNGCSIIGEAEVNPAQPLDVFVEIVHPQCNGSNDGSLLAIAGGNPPFSFLWSNGATGNYINNLSSGVYTVTVTNAISCTTEITNEITDPLALDLTATVIQNVTCHDGQNGAAMVACSGGVPPYTYDWSTGATGTGNSNTQYNLPTGTFTITVTDFNDCSATTNVTVTQPAGLTINPTITNISCHNGNNGAIALNVNGNIGNLSYLWSNAATTSSISGLSAGTYSVTVQDSENNCQKTAMYTLQNPTQLVLNETIQHISCNGANNGSISLNPIGGCTPYIYLWTTGSTNNNLSGLAPGIYTVTLTDCNQCTIIKGITINSPPKIEVNVTQSTNASCLGATNGSLTIQASQGVSPYTYHWSNGMNGPSLSNVAAGNYFTTVVDNNNCIVKDTFTVGVNTSFTINLLTSTNIPCHGDSTGTASVTPNPTYTYLWSTGHTTANVNGLPAGVHTVVATDNAGCQSVPVSVNITQSPLISARLMDADTILCLADTNGYLNVLIGGGTGPLNFVWSHGDTLLFTDSLRAGVYEITITDTLACQEIYDFKIHQSDTIKVTTVNMIQPLCNGDENGAILLTASGGFGDLIYHWSDSLLVGDSIYKLKAGNYYTTISDAGNCQIRDSFLLAQPNILGANAIVTNETENGNNDGTIALNPLGGTAPYQVLWSNLDTLFAIDSLSPGVYQYFITDAHGCTYNNWAVVSGGGCTLTANYTATTASCFNIADAKVDVNITNGVPPYQIEIFKENVKYPSLDSLGIGQYTIIITDSVGCLYIINDLVIVSQYPAIVLDNIEKVRPTTEVSNDGSLTAHIEGGIGLLSYQWLKDGVIIGNTASVSQVKAGKYTLIVSDISGCMLVIEDIALNSISSIDQFDQVQISFVPNPVTESMTISANASITSIELFDVNGKKIHQANPISPTLTLDMQEIGIYQSGIYLCKVKVGHHNISKRIMIVK